MSDVKPVITLILSKPQKIEDVAKWADLAYALGFPETSPVELSMTGAIGVRAYLPQTSVPEPS